jgi:hypothetical protein
MRYEMIIHSSATSRLKSPALVVTGILILLMLLGTFFWGVQEKVIDIKRGDSLERHVSHEESIQIAKKFHLHIWQGDARLARRMRVTPQEAASLTNSELARNRVTVVVHAGDHFRHKWWTWEYIPAAQNPH